MVDGVQGGDGGGVGGDDGDDGGDEEEEEDESDDDYQFAREINFDDSTNPHSLEFLYGAFQGCNPHWDFADRIWKPSSVNWNNANAPKVARTPTDHLQKFIKSFEYEAVLDATMAFTVHPMCNDLRYVLRQDWCGLVVVNVESVSVPNGKDWSMTAKVRMVMSTRQVMSSNMSISASSLGW